ncbi:MAG: DUF3047 domain-containing protein [Deltaproteobacteria bacterium]|nr:DUF3047 domain-containing protein [Deltaproteobacteria bacterium]
MSEIEARYADLLERVPVAELSCFRLPADVPPWTDTALALRPGEAVTLLAWGEVEWAPGSGLREGPGQHLWARVGKGEIFNLPRASVTHRAEDGGTLQLAIYQGEWADRQGGLVTGTEAYALQQGEIEVAVLRWRGDPLEGLDALCAAAPDDAALADERRRLRSPVTPPAGWEYLWFLGEREIFWPEDGRLRVSCDAEVGILQTRAEIALDERTRLDWRWCVQELPSAVAEDSVPTHDYVSIAVEFENGLDLTYYWSAALEPETCFGCPLPTWAARETHLVVRSGQAGLGEWHAESRGLLEDYRRAIGGTTGKPPERVVGVWLIAVSLFQRGRARADFSDIALVRGGERVEVF